MERRSKNWK